MVRYMLAFSAQDLQLAPYLGLMYLIIGIAMVTIFVTGSRTTGPEVGGDKIWWNWARPVHASIYLTFAAMAFNNNPNAWKLLLVDTTLGAAFFAANRILASS